MEHAVPLHCKTPFLFTAHSRSSQTAWYLLSHQPRCDSNSAGQIHGGCCPTESRAEAWAATGSLRLSEATGYFTALLLTHRFTWQHSSWRSRSASPTSVHHWADARLCARREAPANTKNQHPHPSPPSLPHLCRSHLPNTASENFFKGFSDLALGSEPSSAKQDQLSDSSSTCPTPAAERDAALTEEAIRAGSLLLKPVKYFHSFHTEGSVMAGSDISRRCTSEYSNHTLPSPIYFNTQFKQLWPTQIYFKHCRNAPH